MLYSFTDFAEKLGRLTITMLGTFFRVLFKPFILLFRFAKKAASFLFRQFLYSVCPSGIDRRVYYLKVKNAFVYLWDALIFHTLSFPAVLRYFIRRNRSFKQFSFKNFALWTAPVFSLALVVVLFCCMSGRTLAVRVDVNGSTVGYVHNETEFSSAQSEVRQVLSFADDEDSSMDITYAFAYVKDDDISTSAELQNAILENVSSETEFACAVYVDDTLFGIVRSASYARSAFDEVLQNMSNGIVCELACFQQDIKYVEGTYPSSVVMENSAFTKKLEDSSLYDTYYTSVEGDTLESISESQGVALTDLTALNTTLKSGQELTAGTKVRTAAASDFLTLKVMKTVVTTEKTDYETIEVPSNLLYIGTSKTISSGENGSDQVTTLVTYVDGKAVSSTEISRLTVRDSVAERKLVGSKALDSSYSVTMGGVFLWPIVGAYGINSDYGYRWGKLHGGIDLGMGGAAGTSLGKTVVAVAAGTVVTATYHSAYGNYVIIDHGNGLRTLYAHCMNNSLCVSAGEYVVAGQPIAKVGSTGNSTGPHLHFEVRVNGTKVDPKPYLGIG